MTALTEFNEILQEAYKAVDTLLGNEDKGWVQLGGTSGGEFPMAQRPLAIQRSRYYAQIDPMAAQSLRLWTDYTFGTGLTWQTDEESVKEIMDAFWYGHDNAACLSCAGQRKSSHNLLRDGIIYFAIFLGTGADAKLRRIDPLEIEETICDPEDSDTVMYFKRVWMDAQSKQRTEYYRSWQNVKDTAAADSSGTLRQKTQDAIIYRLERDPNGLPLLLPALDWIKLYRQFLASRAAIMLALARFAWRSKVKGGTAAVATLQNQVDQTRPDAASWMVENEGVDTQPIKTDTGAGNAKTDGDMLKLMICAATGIPMQYFGDVSAGQYATAKTVELPMIKMFESYQSVWEDTYNDICDIILEAAGVSEDKRYIDWEFPSITPADAAGIAQNIAALIPVLPELGYSDDVIGAALMSIGIKDINEAIEQLTALATQKDAEQAQKDARQAELTKQYLAKGLDANGQPLPLDAAGQPIIPKKPAGMWTQERGVNIKLAKALKEFQRILPKE